MTIQWIIHVDKNVVQQNAQHGRFDPAIVVFQQIGGDIHEYARAHDVLIQGPARLRHSMEPLPDGTHVWIETSSPLYCAQEG